MCEIDSVDRSPRASCIHDCRRHASQLPRAVEGHALERVRAHQVAVHGGDAALPEGGAEGQC